MKRNRFFYFILFFLTIIAGLLSRHSSIILPQLIYPYLGDILWALMVFWILGFIFRSKDTQWIAIGALVFSYSIEISQLYHATWIDNIRANTLGGLVLGFGFLWSDLVCYTVGVGIGCILESLFLKRKILKKNQ